METRPASRNIFIGAALLAAMTLLPALLAVALRRSPENLGLAMFYWLLGAVPAGSLYLAAGAGAAAGQGSRLRALGSAAAAAALLFFLAWALSGFYQPGLDARLFFIGLPAALLLLVINGFALAAALRRRLAGVLLGAVNLAALAFPLNAAYDLTKLHPGLLPLWPLAAAAALAAAAGPLAALPALSAGRRPLAYLLLALPTLMGTGCWAVLLLRTTGITYHAEEPYYYQNPENPYLLGDAMLVQKPYTGEIFIIDTSGKRTEVSGPGSLRLKNLLPLRRDRTVTAAHGRDGKLWLLLDDNGGTAELLKGGGAGFTQQASVPVEAGFPVRLENAKEPGIFRQTYAQGEYFAPLPYDGKALQWKQFCTSGPACRGTSKTEAEEYPDARLKGGTLVYGKERWLVPGGVTELKGGLVRGVFCRGEAVFFVPARDKGGRFDYLCRAGKKPQRGGYDQFITQHPPHASIFHVTPGGAVWYLSGKSFIIVNEDGTLLPPLRYPAAVRATGADERASVVLRAAGKEVWLNLEGKYLVKLHAGEPERHELWKFPAVTMTEYYYSGGYRTSDYAVSVRAVSSGAMLTAVDGVYLMDWGGGLKKLY